MYARKVQKLLMESLCVLIANTENVYTVLAELNDQLHICKQKLENTTGQDQILSLIFKVLTRARMPLITTMPLTLGHRMVITRQQQAKRWMHGESEGFQLCAC
jgi:hypothetical protein